MNKKRQSSALWKPFLWLSLAIMLMACGSNATSVPSPSVTPTAGNAPTKIIQPTPQPTDTASPEVVPVPTSTPLPLTSKSPTNASLPEGVRTALIQIAEQQKTVSANVVLISYDEVQWNNSCLGVELPDMMCLQVITPGYRIIVQVNGKPFEYHTDISGKRVVQALAARPSAMRPVISWTQSGTQCKQVSIDTRTIAASLCDNPASSPQPIHPERITAVLHFITTYAPFTASTVAGEVTFNGSGIRVAVPSEQRMVAEFASLLYEEVNSRNTAPLSDIALHWRREGGIAGFCDDVTVTIYGEVTISSCKGGTVRALGMQQLAYDELDQLYKWVDTYNSFSTTPPSVTKPDELIYKLEFFGRGTQEVSDESTADMEHLGESLLRTLNR